ncbi:MAG: hypothetical protein GXP32_01795 [Kiritimatiellaeota bacterium]|nr:hypothetical protein [Kiritimatiellota bacterium]
MINIIGYYNTIERSNYDAPPIREASRSPLSPIDIEHARAGKQTGTTFSRPATGQSGFPVAALPGIRTFMPECRRLNAAA